MAGSNDDLLDVVAGRLQTLEDGGREQRELVRPGARGRDDGEGLHLDALRHRAVGDARTDEGAPRKRRNRGPDACEAVLARTDEHAVERLRLAQLGSGSPSTHPTFVLARMENPPGF